MVPPINMWEKSKVNKEREKERMREKWEAHCFFSFLIAMGILRNEFWKVMSFNLIFTLPLGLGLKYKRHKDFGQFSNPIGCKTQFSLDKKE